jgi:uncharacterized UBP type Zn finger protein
MSRFGDGVRGVAAWLSGGDPGCSHLDQAHNVEPLSEGCEACLRSGMTWVHLRLCLDCGNVGCCNDSEGRHAFGHFDETGHPIVRSHEPGEIWSWCWIDEVEL